MLGVEPGGNPLRVLEAAQEQPGADERHERQRDLRGDEQAAQVEHPVRPGGCAGLFLQFDREIGTRRLHGRRQTEHHAGSERHAEREQQDARVRVKIDGVGLQERRPIRPQQVLRPVREHQAERAADQREQRAFGQQLQHQPAAARAE